MEVDRPNEDVNVFTYMFSAATYVALPTVRFNMYLALPKRHAFGDSKYAVESYKFKPSKPPKRFTSISKHAQLSMLGLELTNHLLPCDSSNADTLALA